MFGYSAFQRISSPRIASMRSIVLQERGFPTNFSPSPSICVSTKSIIDDSVVLCSLLHTQVPSHQWFVCHWWSTNLSSTDLQFCFTSKIFPFVIHRLFRKFLLQLSCKCPYDELSLDGSRFPWLRTPSPSIHHIYITLPMAFRTPLSTTK